MRRFGNAGQERRKSPRTTLQKILYVNLESGNGGIVLNLSDGGLAFHSAVPVEQRGAVNLWFSLSNDHRLEASGEVVWTDSKKKTGGLRFTNLPESTRAGIRNLVGELSLLNGPSPSEPAPLPVARQAPIRSREPAHTLLQGYQAPQQPAALPFERNAIADAFRNVRPTDPWAALPPADDGPSLGRVLTLLIVAILTIATGLLVHSHSSEVTTTLGRWSEQLGVNLRPEPPVPPQAPPPQVSPQEALPQVSQGSPDQAAPPPQDAAPVPDLPVASAAPTDETIDPPADVSPAREDRTIPKTVGRHQASLRLASRTAPASAERQAIASVTEDDGEVDLALAQSYLDGKGRIRNSAAAAQFLWAAVAKGNSGAELTLAHLYINGDGVAKSCEQARVLLQAAVSQGDAAAEEALADVRTHCH